MGRKNSKQDQQMARLTHIVQASGSRDDYGRKYAVTTKKLYDVGHIIVQYVHTLFKLVICHELIRLSVWSVDCVVMFIRRQIVSYRYETHIIYLSVFVYMFHFCFNGISRETEYESELARFILVRSVQYNTMFCTWSMHDVYAELNSSFFSQKFELFVYLILVNTHHNFMSAYVFTNHLRLNQVTT